MLETFFRSHSQVSYLVHCQIFDPLFGIHSSYCLFHLDQLFGISLLFDSGARYRTISLRENQKTIVVNRIIMGKRSL